MQVYAYTDEVIDRLNVYARSFTLPLRVRYNLVHPEVSYHWAIFVPTSPFPEIGHYYELAGDDQPYHIKSTIDSYNTRRGFDRGSHTVGYVLPLMLPHLEAHFALVPVQNVTQSWNSQNWVCGALRGLNHPLMFAIEVPLEKLVTQMAILSAIWEAGNINQTMGL